MPHLWSSVVHILKHNLHKGKNLVQDFEALPLRSAEKLLLRNNKVRKERTRCEKKRLIEY